MNTLPRSCSVHFSSKKNTWSTPQWFFDAMNREFGFTIDVCATKSTAKCRRYYSPKDDAFTKTWRGVCWMNPPYGRGIGAWLKKARGSSKTGATVVCLVPARTDTKWWHAYVWNENTQRPRPGVEVRFLKGRLKFGGAKTSAPFPSAVVIYRGKANA